jgi:hypothetical protein
MLRESIFRELKLRRHYEKPSEARIRRRKESVRRIRKLARKAEKVVRTREESLLRSSLARSDDRQR